MTFDRRKTDVERALENLRRLREQIHSELRQLPAPEPLKQTLDEVDSMIGKVEKEVQAISSSPLLNFNEAQRFLRVSHQTMYNLMKEGLPVHRIASKLMFLPDELMRWIREHS